MSSWSSRGRMCSGLRDNSTDKMILTPAGGRSVGSFHLNHLKLRFMTNSLQNLAVCSVCCVKGWWIDSKGSFVRERRIVISLYTRISVRGYTLQALIRESASVYLGIIVLFSLVSKDRANDIAGILDHHLTSINVSLTEQSTAVYGWPVSRNIACMTTLYSFVWLQSK